MDRPPPRRRSPLNNPTERIQRLLTCMDDMQAYCEALEDTIAKHMPEAVLSLPPRPEISEYLLESQRQQFTYGRTIAARNYMQRMRASGEGPAMVSQASQKLRAIARHGLTEEMKAEILAEIDEMPTHQMPAGVRHAHVDTASQLETSAANDAKIGLPAGVQIEADPETEMLEADLKEGKLF